MASVWLLLIVPILVTFAAFRLKEISGPYWLNANLDPSYIYLMNSLNVANLHRPLHTDHPGTPVQVAGGLIIRALNLGSDENSTAKSVISNPEGYLHTINNILTITYALCLLGVGYVSLLVWQNVLAGMLIQVTPFIALDIVVRIFGVTPETLLMSISMLFVAIILLTLRFDVKRHAFGYSLAFGLLSGLGLSCKFTFVPLLLIPVILLPTWKWKLVFMFVALVAFAVFIFPILTPSLLKNMFGFLFGIVTHTERYGGGEARIINPHRYLSNLVDLIKGEALFFSIVTGAFIALVVKRKYLLKDARYKALVAVTAAQVLQLLMVARHPGSNRYFLPALSLVGVSLVLVLETLTQKLSVISNRYRYLPGMLICLVILIVQVKATKTLYNNWEAETRGLGAVHTKLAQEYKNALVVYYHGASSNVFALKAGSYYSGDYYGEIMQEIYPNNIFYDTWARRFSNFKETVDIEHARGTENWFLMHGCYFKDIQDPDMKNITSVLPNNAKLEMIYHQPADQSRSSFYSDRTPYLDYEAIYMVTIGRN